MNDYVILTDSTSDLPSNIISKFDIDILPMRFMIGDEIYMDGDISPKDFYSNMRNGLRVSTSQITPGEFEDYFEKYLKMGKDILYVSLSSSFSGTYNAACVAQKELSTRYPGCKIKIVDSLSASLGQGLIVYHVAQLRNQGWSIDDVEKWANQHRMKVCHWFLVDDLYHLQRGGRISSTVAFFGSVVNVKPVLYINDDGVLAIANKVRGRAKAIDILVSKLGNLGENIENQLLCIVHADCFEDANCLAGKLKDKFKFKDLIINDIDSIIGAHVGRGALGLFFMGQNR